jgi:hypothetical protein
MTTSDTGRPPVLLGEVRARRAELRQSISGLERALAGAAGDGRGWARRVDEAAAQLAGDFEVHVAVTEGTDGLYQDLHRTAPRLASPVAELTADHGLVRERIEGLRACLDKVEGPGDVARVRELGTDLIGVLLRHRQRGADLVYEAYQVDIGGET